jgi:hypothetical protein
VGSRKELVSSNMDKARSGVALLIVLLSASMRGGCT